MHDARAESREREWASAGQGLEDAGGDRSSHPHRARGRAPGCRSRRAPSPRTRRFPDRGRPDGALRKGGRSITGTRDGKQKRSVVTGARVGEAAVACRTGVVRPRCTRSRYVPDVRDNLYVGSQTERMQTECGPPLPQCSSTGQACLTGMTSKTPHRERRDRFTASLRASILPERRTAPVAGTNLGSTQRGRRPHRPARRASLDGDRWRHRRSCRSV